MTAPRARCVIVDLDAPPPAVDWAEAPLWRIIATTRAVPCWAGWVVSPGRLLDPEAFLERTLADARERAAELALEERFARQLGIHHPQPPPQTVSVVVCTHRRARFLPDLLASLTALSPAPAEVIIVDNDPGEEDCRALVLAHGARYVREDRRGLDHARAAGLAVATGSIVAYTDDDCVLPKGWLARVDRNFADPAVDAVTGPAFAHELESAAQLRFELEGGFNRGFVERQFDWTTIAPSVSGAVGAGANMMFRRSRLQTLGDPFPPELDAGTLAQTGGDLWVLYRVLEAGSRVLYDPGSYLFHRHRRDVDALERTFLGYGTGILAAFGKLLVERHELEAVLLLRWLWSQYHQSLKWRLIGQMESRSLRIRALYLLGGVRGVFSWPRSLAAERRADAAERSATATDPVGEAPAAGAEACRPVPPTLPPGIRHPVSVIIPTVGRPDVLTRCLAALPPTSADHQIIVVDDRPAAASSSLPGVLPPGVEVIRSGGIGAAAARNAGARHARGEILLFLDDDLVAGEGLVDRHRAIHAELEDAFVIGYSPPAPRAPGWAALGAALWWHDHFRAVASRRQLTATDMLSGNVSIRRDRFLALGGFPERVGRMRREDWLFGMTVLRAGMDVRYEPRAVARHEFALSTAARLRAAAAEGYGDAILASTGPAFAAALPPVLPQGHFRTLTIAGSILARPRGRRFSVDALDLLERLRLRGLWLQLFGDLQQALYQHSRRQERARRDAPGGAPERPALAVTPAGERCAFDGPLAPDLLVSADGRLARVASDRGRWTIAEARAAAGVIAATGQLRPAQRPPQLAGLRIALVAMAEDVSPAVEIEAATSDVQLRLLTAAESPWEELERLFGARDADIVWIALPDTLVGGSAVAELRSLSDGERVAMTLLERGPQAARYLFDSSMDTRDWLLLAEAPAILGIRADAFERLGGVRAGLETIGGPATPALDLLRRAMRRGEVVGHGTVTGIELRGSVRRPWRGPEWRRQRPHGARLAVEPLPLAVVHLLRVAARITILGVSGGRRYRGRLAALAGLAHGAIGGGSARRDGHQLQ